MNGTRRTKRRRGKKRNKNKKKNRKKKGRERERGRESIHWRLPVLNANIEGTHCGEVIVVVGITRDRREAKRESVAWCM
jgi:hypothetical protein